MAFVPPIHKKVPDMVKANTLALGFALLSVVVSQSWAQEFDPGGLTLMKVKPLAERAQEPEDIAVAVWPSGVIDAENTHYLTQNNLTVVEIAIANPKARKIASSRMICDLPADVMLDAVNTNLVWNTRTREKIDREGQTYVRYSIEMRPSRYTIPDGKLGNTWYARYQPPSFWVRTKLAPGSTPGKIYVSLSYVDHDEGATKQSPESTVDIAVLPELKVNTPHIAKVGVMGRSPTAISAYENDAHEEHSRLLGSYIKNLGCNIQICAIPQRNCPDGLRRWTEGRNIHHVNKGFRHNENEPVGVGNGFFVHLTPEVRRTIPIEIQRLNEKGERVMGGTLAPWAIYRRHPWVQENVLDVIAASVERGDYDVLWANWEPHLDERDYSDRSQSEFFKWSDLAPDQINNLWLDGLVKKYPEMWWEFRNWELGQVVKTYSDVIREAGESAGRDTRFMICLPQDCMILDDDYTLVPWQALRWDDLPVILQTWSYHNMPRSDQRFPQNDKMIQDMVARSAWVRRYIDEELGRDREMWLGCTYGWEQTEGRASYYVPEDLAFRQLSGPMTGCEVAINYAEWTVWDGRYATALAHAHTRIARWEEYTLRGRIQSKHTVAPVSPYPQNIPDDVKPSNRHIHGSWPGGNYVYTYEYRKNDSRLVAIANNWHFGDVFLKLRVFDLDSNDQYVLWEPEEGRIFANSDGELGLSAQELTDGIVVHVGATRWGAFLVEPFDSSKDYGVAVKPARIATIAKKRQATLEVALKRSAEFQ